MTLQEFLRETAGYPADTELMVLNAWGDMEPAAYIGRADLEDNDPLRESFPDNTLLLTGAAD